MFLNLSIEQRLSRGIFLITELLGFHRDENGNLIIKEDEADTVRICFYLFRGGYSTRGIAEILTIYVRLLPNPKWGNFPYISLVTTSPSVVK